MLALRVDDEDVIKRLLPARLKIWQDKMKAKKDKRKARQQKKKEKLAKKMKERRDEEIAKYEERRREREEEAAANGEEPEEEDFDVEAIINEEFAEELQEEEEIDDVQEDEIKENMINDLRTQYENQTNAIESVKENLQEAQIPRFNVVGNRKQTIVRYLIEKKLQRFVEFRQSLLERVYPIKVKMANKLIDVGFKHLSRFGRWCPVKLIGEHPVKPLSDDKHKIYPVVHRSFVYFLSSKGARVKFSQDPLRYLKQPSPLSVVPFKLSIIGPPKSGKTTLANRFVKEFGCVRLSLGEAIRMILENQPDTELAENINAHLIKGKIVPDELAIQCVEVAIMDVKCQINGFVLDNYPVTKNQIKLMTDRCLIPVKVIELKCEIKEIMSRCLKDRTNADRLARGLVLNDSPEIIGYKLREWKSEIGFIRDWYVNFDT
jgi:adenylate/nucleoside-diphosphate kinase